MKEIELRSFITKERYEALMKYFNEEGELISADEEETHYLDCDQDLRLQKNDSYSKVWLKKGKIHDDVREEVELRFAPEEFSKLSSIFENIGLGVEIKWFRTRHTFRWKGVDVMLDYTKGYGYILEMEILSDGSAEESLSRLRDLFSELDIRMTPKEEFNRKYRDYKLNWRDYTS